jgi:hypothetical protein
MSTRSSAKNSTSVDHPAEDDSPRQLRSSKPASAPRSAKNSMSVGHSAEDDAPRQLRSSKPASAPRSTGTRHVPVTKNTRPKKGGGDVETISEANEGAEQEGSDEGTEGNKVSHFLCPSLSNSHYVCIRSMKANLWLLDSLPSSKGF